MEFFDAVVGGRSVGVPGIPRLLETVHKRYGKLPWAAPFAPAIELVGKRLQCFGAHEHVDPPGSRPARPAAGGPRLFLRCGRRAAAGRHAARQPALCRDAEGDRRRRRRRLLQGQDRRRHRGRGQRPSDQSRRPQPRRSRRLPGQGAAGGLRALSRPRGLRHGTALLRCAVDRPDSRADRAVRHRDARPGRSREPGASSATPRGSPSPTASATSPTAIS